LNPFKPATKNSKNNFSSSFSAFSPVANFLFPFNSHLKLLARLALWPNSALPGTFLPLSAGASRRRRPCANRPTLHQTSSLDSYSIFPIKRRPSLFTSQITGAFKSRAFKPHHRRPSTTSSRLTSYPDPTKGRPHL
jgi:hypothetical protein